MAAYAVMTRIERVEPHLTVLDVVRDEPDDRVGVALALDPFDEVAALESDQEPEPGQIVERLIRARELWRQTTFYLFDADSWRA